METTPLPSPSLAPTVRFTRSRAATTTVANEASAPRPDTSWRTTARVSAVVFAIAIAYAVVRYVLLGTVDAAHVPIFILNKATAVSSVVLLAICLAIRRPAWRPLKKTFGIAGFAAGALHTIMTLSIASPAYYGKFFADDGRLGFRGEMIFLTGIVCLGLLIPVAMTSLPGVREAMRPDGWRSIQRWAVPAFYLAGVHVVVMGVPVWLAPSTWPGGLPPITLLAVLVVVATALLRRASSR